MCRSSERSAINRLSLGSLRALAEARAARSISQVRILLLPHAEGRFAHSVLAADVGHLRTTFVMVPRTQRSALPYASSSLSRPLFSSKRTTPKHRRLNLSLARLSGLVIVIARLRGEDNIAELCPEEGINQNLYYRWFKTSWSESRCGTRPSCRGFVGDHRDRVVKDRALRRAGEQKASIPASHIGAIVDGISALRLGNLNETFVTVAQHFS
jgi:hypothetical protein